MIWRLFPMPVLYKARCDKICHQHQHNKKGAMQMYLHGALSFMQ